MLAQPPTPPSHPGEDQHPGPVAELAGRWTQQLLHSGHRPRVAFAEGTDPRVLWAATQLAWQGAVTPVLLGDPAQLRQCAADAQLTLPPADSGLVDIRDPAQLATDPRYTAHLGPVLDARRQLSTAQRRERAADPLYLAATALHLEDVDVCLAGSSRPTADVLRAGLHVVGLAPETRTLSSSFLMVLPDGRVLGYGDCAVVVDPDPPQLADIAQATADTFRNLIGETPRVALLSFSTRASASHPRVERVREAVQLVRDSGTGLLVDGDVQYDAATVPAVSRDKTPSSPLEGRANTFVFPCLEAGNIAYKVAQRVGGAAAIGPLLQGLAAPLHDLSRGCRGPDIAALALAGALQAAARTRPHPLHPPANTAPQEGRSCP